jgi:predicted ATP-grasp superfamily ATP-dependent carboligase
MNLLVTNTRNSQAYAIIRALRPYAERTVATMEGENFIAARLAHAANSRLVDKRYHTPSPAKDWMAGRIQRENTEREESYIRAVETICEKEKIDTIFPSFDPHVYVFSKNKERFEKMGILIPVPDYETVITPLDKYRTVRAAEEAGLPCPRTYLPENGDELERIADEVGFPLVIKPRFTAGGWGTSIVRKFSELSETTDFVRKHRGMPIIQEHIPGGRRENFHLVTDKNGKLKAVFSSTIHRNFRIDGGYGYGQETTVPHPYFAAAATLVRKMGWWGGALVETRVDPRDGIHKLMEINPRFGNRLWVRSELGVNEPLMCIKIAEGKDVGATRIYPAGIVLVDIVEDVITLGFQLLDLLAYRFRIGFLGMEPLDPFNPPMTLKELVQSYSHTYFKGKVKAYNPYSKYFFQDPLVSIIWYLQFLILILKQAKQLGR